jgi:hypothetical protein
MQGVLLPTLGTIYVGSAKPRPGYSSTNNVEPFLVLHEGRFAGATQDLPRATGKWQPCPFDVAESREMNRGSGGCRSCSVDTLKHESHSVIKRAPLADKSHIRQLNYHAVGKNLPLHRAAVQRLTTDLLARLGTYIADGLELRVWPSPVTDHSHRLRVSGAHLSWAQLV